MRSQKRNTWISRSAFPILTKGISLLLGVFLVFQLSGQNDRKALEAKRKQKQKEIELTRKLLSATTDKKNKSLNELRLLNKQIKMREELISTVNSEIMTLDEQIAATSSQIDELNEELLLRKKEYGDLLYMSYKSRGVYDQLSFYLSATSFNQAIMRFKYVQQLAESRNRQLAMITETQAQISAQLVQLQEVRGDKTVLLTEKEEEKTGLEEDKTEQNKLAQTLKKREKELKADLAKKQKAAKQLDDQIQKLIAEEIRKSKEKKGTTKPKTGEMALTPEAVALSTSFNLNKGKLPWPVESGFVIRSFGEHAHPTLPNVRTVNNGVDIVTTDGSLARTVFEGEVRAIFSVPNMQNAVMINHGEFFTVYTHIDVVQVKKGDKVKTKQAIGTIFKDTDDNKTILHFEMWKGSTKLNPEDWIFPN